MHLFKAKKILKGYHLYARESIRLVEKSMQDGHTKQTPSKELYSQIHKEPFETAVLEKTQRVAVVPCDIDWSDVGTFNSLWDIRAKDPHGNVTDGNVACYKTKNCFVQSEDRLVTCVGVQDLIVMETPDAILVADKHSSDDIKIMVNGLKQNKPEFVNDQYKRTYTWGTKKVLSKAYDCVTSEIIVKPGFNRCNHANKKASKLCTVLSGKALVKIGNDTHFLEPQQSLMIEKSVPHLIVNTGDQDLYMIEVQHGVQNAKSDVQHVDDIQRLSA